MNVNFERMQVVADYFMGELSPERIIRLLEEYFGQKIVPEETLLIFDEIFLGSQSTGNPILFP